MTKHLPIYVFALIGVAIIFYVGANGANLISPQGWLGDYHVRNIWQIWDVAAAFWSFWFFFYYIFEFTSTRNQAWDKFFLVTLAGSSIIVPGVIFYYLLADYNPARAIGWTFGLNVVYLFIDGLLALRHPDLDRQRGYQEAFLLADIPIVTSNFAFLTWLHFHSEPNWAIFASGMIGFQLLSCNIIFVITQAGVVRAIWAKEEAAA